MLRQLTILLLLLGLFTSDKIVIKIIDPVPTVFLNPSVKSLLEQALKSKNTKFDNTYEIDLADQFQFFQSGHILDSTEVNAISVKCGNDTTYTLKLYSLKNLTWILLDSIGELDAYPWQFDLNLKDYNFDGQTDIYIQVSASNGWSLSRGHLILINPLSKKLELHNETRDFANMSVDPCSKSIFTEEWQGYDSLNNPHLTIFTNKWIDGKLKTIDKCDRIIKN
jgi:hypothetical protein